MPLEYSWESGKTLGMRIIGGPHHGVYYQMSTAGADAVVRKVARTDDANSRWCHFQGELEAVFEFVVQRSRAYGSSRALYRERCARSEALERPP